MKCLLSEESLLFIFSKFCIVHTLESPFIQGIERNIKY